MPNIAKYHHIVPVLLLKRFTISGNEDGTLWVLNLDHKKSRPSTPTSTGGQNHYNSIDIPGVKRDVIEKVLSDGFESPAARVITEIISKKELPKGKDFGALMRFVALMSSRVEGVRQARI